MPRKADTPVKTSNYTPALNQARLDLGKGLRMASMKELADHLNTFIPKVYHNSENGSFREFTMYGWNWGARHPAILLMDTLYRNTQEGGWENRFAWQMRMLAIEQAPKQVRHRPAAPAPVPAD